MNKNRKIKIIFKFITIIASSLMLTNCTSEWVQSSKDCGPDFRDGDPCISQGESWIFIPNEPNGAIREAERQGFYWGCGAVTNSKCRDKLHY